MTRKSKIQTHGSDGNRKISRRQLQANRFNAQHSTGPKTEFGKSRSKMNALKHGLTAAQVVVLDEDPAQFDALRSDLKAHFEPKDPLERELLDLIAGSLWRLRRVPFVEAALIRHEMEKAEASEVQEKGRAVEELRADLARMRVRMQLAADQKAAVTGDDEAVRTNDTEAARADDNKATRADPEETVSEQPGSREARRKRIDRVLALIVDKNSIGNLLRYEASLITSLSRAVALLRLCQALRI